MIAQLRGIVSVVDAERLLVDVSGVGYEVTATRSAVEGSEPGEEATLLIHTHMSDSALRLFGFATRAEKALFERLISISGIGPKTAIGILSTLPPSDLVGMIVQGDSKGLAKLPGIGKKTAERIVVELKDKLDSVQGVVSQDRRLSSLPVPTVAEDDAIAALVQLGYRRPEAVSAVQKALENDETLAAEASHLVRGALRMLAKV